MNIFLLVDGKKIPCYMDVNEVVECMNTLNRRKPLHILIYGLLNEVGDFLVNVRSYKDKSILFFECVRVYRSIRGVRYFTAFY